MKGVDTIARIRREFFIRGRSIKEIVRDLHVSRNTVRKVVRSGRRRSATSGMSSRYRSWGNGGLISTGFS
jgi:orotate phosphoribosyltransferase-like protein